MAAVRSELDTLLCVVIVTRTARTAAAVVTATVTVNIPLAAICSDPL